MRSLAAAVLLIVSCVASTVQGDVTPNVWNSSFPSSLKYAQEHGLPLVMTWSNWGCTYCQDLTAALDTAEFMNWAAASPNDYVLCHVQGYNGRDLEANKGAREFAGTANGTRPTELGGFPFVCLYMPYDGGRVFCVTNFIGRYGQMTGSRKWGTLADQMISSIEDFMAGAEAPDPCVEFPMGDVVNDRLEAIAGETDWVEVPLRRTNYTNMEARASLTLDLGAGVKVVSNLTWVAGDVAKSVRFVLPTDRAAGATLALTLRNYAGMELAVRHVTYVDPKSAALENSPKNPRFIGERTASTLAWGEWTMDYEVARQKAAAEEGASTLVLIGGSLWCPDCYSTDRFLIDTPEFKAWAVSHKIACVAIDVWNPKSTVNASLLTWNSVTTGDRYVTCNYGLPADESLRHQSGAGYLSRHRVTADVAAAVAARNQTYLSTSTAEGGFCRPEDAAGQGKTYGFMAGIPCLLVVRNDGSVAGRIYQFNNVSASSAVDLSAHLKRLQEMVDQKARSEEEDNDHALTTRDVIKPGQSVSASVSAVDGLDVYKIDAPVYTRTVFSLSGAENAVVTLEVTDDSGAVSKSLAAVTGNLADGLSVSARLSSGNCHATVSFPKDADGYATGGFFAFSNVASTVCAYGLSMTGEMSGGEVGFGQSVMEASESESVVRIPVARTCGSGGRLAVQVRLERTAVAEAALKDGRIEWTDTPLVWQDGESGEKTVSLKVKDDAVYLEDLMLGFSITDLAAQKTDARIADGLGSLVLRIRDDDGTAILLHKSMRVDERCALEGWRPGDEVVIDKLSGSLPAGLRVSVTDGAVAVNGVPRILGEYRSRYRAVIYRAGAVASVREIEFEFSVREPLFASVIPSLATARTYSNLPLTELECTDCGDLRTQLTGLLTVTVPASGKLSAKLISGGRVHVYDTDGWDSFDGVRTIRATLRAEFESEDAPAAIGVALTADTLTLALPGGDLSVPSLGWSASHDAAAWLGQYTVQMPQTGMADTAKTLRMTGDAYMAMRMITQTASRNGYMIYAGLMPNGRAFSGSAVLLERQDGFCELPFLNVVDEGISGYGISGVLSIKGNPKDTLWSVRAADRALTCWRDESLGLAHSSDLQVYGTYYDSATVYAKFLEDYAEKTGSFALHAGVEGFDPVAAQMTEAGPVLKSTERATLSFSPVTGVVSGILDLDGIGPTAYRGVVLPGWQACPDCKPGVEFVERPWASGVTAYYAFGENARRDGARIELKCK